MVPAASRRLSTDEEATVRHPEAPRTRFMTWNVLWRFEPDWRARERAILAVLEEAQPDVLGLQECWGTAEETQAGRLADRLGMHAAFLAPSLPPTPVPPEHPDQQGVLLGVGLVSRWPITHLRRHTLPARHGQVAPVALQARTGDGGHRSFEVVVAATEWEPERADDHLAQTQALASLLGADHDTPAPTVLLADLNCDPGQTEFAPFTDVADDLWALAGDDPDAVTLSSAVPFAPVEAVKQIDRRVDHILARRGTGVAAVGAFTISTPVDGVFPSDHFPVVVDVLKP